MSKSDQEKQEEEDAALEEAFQFMDKDKNGFISINEVGFAMRALGYNPSKSEEDDFMRKCDKDESGIIDIKEFKAYMKEYKIKHPSPVDEMRNAFKMFDKDGNGYIDAKELKAVFQRFGQILTEEELDDVIACADVDNDKKINYNEFAQFICQTQCTGGDVTDDVRFVCGDDIVNVDDGGVVKIDDEVVEWTELEFNDVLEIDDEVVEWTELEFNDVVEIAESSLVVVAGTIVVDEDWTIVDVVEMVVETLEDDGGINPASLPDEQLGVSCDHDPSMRHSDVLDPER
ncbi:hypothetical protein ACF0H5_022366 [Mactra antiquata]